MFLTASALILLCMLVRLSIVDWRNFRLPDIYTFPLIILGLGFSYRQGFMSDALIGSAVGYACLVGLELAYKHTRGIDGLGRGDAKLLAAGGAWCGWFGLPFIVLIASAGGLIHAGLISWRTKNKASQDMAALHIPFGPYLSLGIFLTWLGIYVFS